MICNTIKNRCNFLTGYIALRFYAAVGVTVNIANMCGVIASENILCVFSCIVNNFGAATATTSATAAGGFNNRINSRKDFSVNTVCAILWFTLATGSTNTIIAASVIKYRLYCSRFC